MRKIHYLQYASIVGSLMLIYSIIVIIAQLNTNYNISLKTYNAVPFEKLNWDHANCLAIFIFGFSSHNGVLQIFSELNRKSKVRAAKILNRSFIMEIILYSCIAFGGYFSFLSGTKDNILSNYGVDDKFIVVSKVSLFVTLHCSIAFSYNLIRGSYQSMFGEKKFSFLKDSILCFITLLFANAFVYFVKTVAVILGISGGISCVIMCYFNPIMIYVRTNNHSRYSIYNIFAIIILIFTCIIGTISTGYSLIEFVKSLNVTE